MRPTNIATYFQQHITGNLKTVPIKIKAALLYGSWAKAEQTPDSDIDLLIISEGINPKRHRRGKEIALIKEWFSSGLPLDILLLTANECISNFRNHNPLFLDMACEGIILIDEDDFLKNLLDETVEYIKERRLDKLEDGWKFPILWREPSFLSKVSNRDFAMVMLRDGERDFVIGINIMENGYFDKAVYHFQQAVEKAVKSVLISFGEFKKTHFVGSILIEQLKKTELAQEWKEKLIQLAKISNEIEPEVTWSRYPGIESDTLWIPYEEYTIDDAKVSREKCEKAVKITKEFLEWWFKIQI